MSMFRQQPMTMLNTLHPDPRTVLESITSYHTACFLPSPFPSSPTGGWGGSPVRTHPKDVDGIHVVFKYKMKQSTPGSMKSRCNPGVRCRRFPPRAPPNRPSPSSVCVCAASTAGRENNLGAVVLAPHFFLSAKSSVPEGWRGRGVIGWLSVIPERGQRAPFDAGRVEQLQRDSRG